LRHIDNCQRCAAATPWQKVRRQPLTLMTGQWRTRPVITPDDPEKVAAELAGHGVNVS
jgi:hypothetical protein